MSDEWHDFFEREHWEGVKERCPGTGRGTLYTREQIDRIVDDQGAT